MCDKLYREEERSKWTKEIGRIALKKQHNIIDSLKEMASFIKFEDLFIL